MFRFFTTRNTDRLLNEMLERSERMEKYYLGKAVEASKRDVPDIDVDDMVAKFKDDMIGEHDSATTHSMAESYAVYYRKGIGDALKAVKEKVHYVDGNSWRKPTASAVG